MKVSLSELKRETYRAWESINLTHKTLIGEPSWRLSQEESRQLPYTCVAFRAEIRKDYGDLRCRRTWEDAAVRLIARNQCDRLAWAAPDAFVVWLVKPGAVIESIRERLWAEMEAYPHFWDLVKGGLEMIYGEAEYHSEAERAAAAKLLQELKARGQSLPKALAAVA